VPSIEQLGRLLQADPEDPFLLYGMAQELARRGDHAGALEWYDRCLRADGAYCYAYFHKARSQQALGRGAEALATVRLGLGAARAAADSHALGELQALEAELE
jgi:tetratricopeptide (TPR) repeat protein